MKKVVIIGLILIVGGFFTFFDVEVNDTNGLSFIEGYKTEIGFDDFEAKKTIMSNTGQEGIKFIFKNCKIDSTNVKRVAELSTSLAREINGELNKENSYETITLIFEPTNPEAISNKALLKINELTYRYKTEEL